MEAKQICQKLSKLLDEDFHLREFQLYKNLVYRNINHNKIKTLFLSWKTDSFLLKWGHEPQSFTQFSLVPRLKQATYNFPVQSLRYNLSNLGNNHLLYQLAPLLKNFSNKLTSKN